MQSDEQACRFSFDYTDKESEGDSVASGLRGLQPGIPLLLVSSGGWMGSILPILFDNPPLGVTARPRFKPPTFLPRKEKGTQGGCEIRRTKGKGFALREENF